MSAPTSLFSSYLFSHSNTRQDGNIGYLFISIGLASVLLVKLTSNMEDCYLLKHVLKRPENTLKENTVKHQDPGTCRLVRGEPAPGDHGHPRQAGGEGNNGPALPVQICRHPHDTLARDHQLHHGSHGEEGLM